MPTDIAISTHAETTRLEIHELVGRMNMHLGASVVATLAGVNDSKLPYRWAKIDGPTPNNGALSRLTAAHRVWIMVADAESDHVARNWFVGANPYLGEQAPVLALREGREVEVLKAAEAFVEGTWVG